MLASLVDSKVIASETRWIQVNLRSKLASAQTTTFQLGAEVPPTLLIKSRDLSVAIRARTRRIG